MFFGKRQQWNKQEERMHQLETKINEIGGILNALKEYLREEPWEKMQKELQEARREDEKWIRRQSESFEDLLEELQETRTEQSVAERLVKEYELREQRLLTLIGSQREQLELLERQIQKDHSQSGEKREAWTKQFDVMNREAWKLMRSCNLAETGAVGEPLDYEIHEVLELVNTEEDHLAGTIAEVFCRGRFYGDRLLKKAQVAVYKKHADADDAIQEEYR